MFSACCLVLDFVPRADESGTAGGGDGMVKVRVEAGDRAHRQDQVGMFGPRVISAQESCWLPAIARSAILILWCRLQGNR